MHLPVLCVAAREEKLALPFIHAFRQRLYMYISSWMNTSLMWSLLMWNSQSDPVPVWEEAEQWVMRHWSSLAWAPVCFSWRVRQQESRRKVGRDPTTTKIAQELLFVILSGSINTKMRLSYTYCKKNPEKTTKHKTSLLRQVLLVDHLSLYYILSEIVWQWIWHFLVILANITWRVHITSSCC